MRRVLLFLAKYWPVEDPKFLGLAIALKKGCGDTKCRADSDELGAEYGKYIATSKGK